MSGVLGFIERAYSEFYDFNVLAPVVEYVDIKQDPDLTGSTNFVLERGGEISIEVTLGKAWVDRAKNVLTEGIQDIDTLNGFLIAAEEVSHFHYILQKLSLNQEFSILELEWQAEVDKMVVLNSLNLFLSGNSHFPIQPWISRLYGQAVQYSCPEESELRYREAHLLARKFMASIADLVQPYGSLVCDGRAQAILKNVYGLPWCKKLEAINSGRFW